MDRVDITVIGAGVVGLAIAAELSKDHSDIVVLERHDDIGRETSSRNSEVIHAGIYYPPGSLKASLCVEGARLLYEYCQTHDMPCARIGKLIVASGADEVSELEVLYGKARENGVQGLRVLDGKEVADMEPNVSAAAAIFSPATGIVDVHSLMKKLHGEARERGVLISFGSEVAVIERKKGGYMIGVGDYRFFSRIVVNSAGLSADRVASIAGIDVDLESYRLEYVKGSYFSYTKKSPVGRLVYPLPMKGRPGLGIHATLDLQGRLRFGPDSERVTSLDYGVDGGKRDAFHKSVSRYINGLDREAFSPDMAGIRPVPKGGSGDFVVRHEAGRGLEGLITLIGIDSPGLTASLSIARWVRGMLDEA